MQWLCLALHTWLVTTPNNRLKIRSANSSTCSTSSKMRQSSLVLRNHLQQVNTPFYNCAWVLSLQESKASLLKNPCSLNCSMNTLLTPRNVMPKHLWSPRCLLSSLILQILETSLHLSSFSYWRETKITLNQWFQSCRLLKTLKHTIVLHGQSMQCWHIWSLIIIH